MPRPRGPAWRSRVSAARAVEKVPQTTRTNNPSSLPPVWSCTVHHVAANWSFAIVEGFPIQGCRVQIADQVVLANGGAAIHRNVLSIRFHVCACSASRLSSIIHSTVVVHPPGTHFP